MLEPVLDRDPAAMEGGWCLWNEIVSPRLLTMARLRSPHEMMLRSAVEHLISACRDIAVCKIDAGADTHPASGWCGVRTMRNRSGHGACPNIDPARIGGLCIGCRVQIVVDRREHGAGWRYHRCCSAPPASRSERTTPEAWTAVSTRNRWTFRAGSARPCQTELSESTSRTMSPCPSVWPTPLCG